RAQPKPPAGRKVLLYTLRARQLAQPPRPDPWSHASPQHAAGRSRALSPMFHVEHWFTREQCLPEAKNRRREQAPAVHGTVARNPTPLTNSCSRYEASANRSTGRSLVEHELLGVDERPQDVLVGDLLVRGVLVDVRQGGVPLLLRRLVRPGPVEQLLHLL